MATKHTVWGMLLIAAGAVVAQTSGAVGPRIGMSVFLIVLGLTVAAMGNVTWFLEKTTQPRDYKGICPVGASCASCGAWNRFGRSECRSCQVSLSATQAS